MRKKRARGERWGSREREEEEEGDSEGFSLQKRAAASLLTKEKE